MGTPIQRDAARVVLVDPGDRVLLFRYQLPSPWSGDGWLTPGGGIESGEAPVQAAVRELREETGHRLTCAQLGSPVATQSGCWAVAGTNYVSVNWFFFARTRVNSLDLSGQEASERSGLLGCRWWSLADVRQTDKVVLPVGLADLTARLLYGGPLPELVRLPWR